MHKRVSKNNSNSEKTKKQKKQQDNRPRQIFQISNLSASKRFSWSLLAWLKFQTKIPSRYGVFVQGVWQKYTPPSPLLSKDERLRDMSTGNIISGVNSVTVSYLIHYDSLLQNAADIIIKCDSYFITKCNRSLLQNTSGFLLQNATV